MEGFQWIRLCKPVIGNHKHLCGNWKSNIFTRFYFKDLAGQDQTEGSYHLGAFIVAQQVMPPSEPALGSKEGRHETGNYVDGACLNPLTP